MSDPIDEGILAALAAGGDLGLVEISASVGLDVARRTLQRRLAALVEAGRIRAIGRARGRRYALAAQAGTRHSVEPATISAPPEGEELRRYVRRAALKERTATRDLARLVEVGLLEPRGQTRGRYYVAAPQLLEIRRELWSERAAVTDPYPWLRAALLEPWPGR